MVGTHSGGGDSHRYFVTALDVGTTKVCCFIARADGDGGLRVIGIGHQASRGMRAGTVIDMEAVEDSVRSAVDSAERMAGEAVRDVHVSIASGRPQSHFIGVEVAVDGHEIGDADFRNRAIGQLQIAWSIGAFLTTILAYYFRYWRHLIWIQSILLTASLFGYLFIKETPLFLITTQKFEEFKAVI